MYCCSIVAPRWSARNVIPILACMAAALATEGALSEQRQSRDAPSIAWDGSAPKLVHDSIDGIGLDFDDRSALPMVAYGFIAKSGGSPTTIEFLRLADSGDSWSSLGHHTP